MRRQRRSHFLQPIESICGAVVRPLPYEQKLALMMEPLDFPILRLMTTKQATAYLDAIHRHFSQKAIALTDPGA